MKILIVSFVDDNFGDNLIRICFESLLKVVLQNLNISSKEYQICKMPLKKVEPELVKDSDIIFFAGGGLFGLSYLNFFTYLDEITRLAEEKEIPVIFSSIGINNMDATPENEELLRSILRRRCIRSISVRENIDLFRSYAQGCSFEIEKVSDPAVWTRYVYDLEPKRRSHVVGINVVRGGLFKDNQKSWGMTDELQYISQLKSLLETAGFEPVFYTNGSFLDNNTLRYFAREYGVPANQIVYPHTTKEVVETLSAFEAVITFRMHSSIIAYSFEIPSVALAWNEKIPFFYEDIRHPDRVFAFSDWNSETIFHKLNAILKEEKPPEVQDPEYLMSLYLYLYKVLFQQFPSKTETPPDSPYAFQKITALLAENAQSIQEDIADLRFKMEKGEKHYLARFTDLRKRDKEILDFRKELGKARNSLTASQKKLEELTAKMAQQKQKIETQKAELKQLNQIFVIRVMKYIRRKLRKK